MSAYSVCIPRIFSNIPNKKIVSTFEVLNLGKVSKLDIVWKTGRDGSSFKMAFVHFSEWNNDNSAAVNFREKVENPNVEAKLIYDDPWYWIVLPNNSNNMREPINTNNETRHGIRYVSDDEDNNRHTPTYTTVLRDVNGWINDRLLHLEEEINCIYEELYQREYIPVKYRTIRDLDSDIETGNSDVPVYENISPMTIDELDCDNNDYLYETYENASFETYNAARNDALHLPPSHAVIRPYNEQEDEIDYYVNNINQHTVPINNCIQDINPYECAQQPIENSDDVVVTINHNINNTHSKLWMTMNYCGNA
jgi:hypothetical protein